MPTADIFLSHCYHSTNHLTLPSNRFSPVPPGRFCRPSVPSLLLSRGPRLPHDLFRHSLSFHPLEIPKKNLSNAEQHISPTVPYWLRHVVIHPDDSLFIFFMNTNRPKPTGHKKHSMLRTPKPFHTSSTLTFSAGDVHPTRSSLELLAELPPRRARLSISRGNGGNFSTCTLSQACAPPLLPSLLLPREGREGRRRGGMDPSPCSHSAARGPVRFLRANKKPSQWHPSCFIFFLMKKETCFVRCVFFCVFGFFESKNLPGTLFFSSDFQPNKKGMFGSPLRNPLRVFICVFHVYFLLVERGSEGGWVGVGWDGEGGEGEGGGGVGFSVFCQGEFGTTCCSRALMKRLI